MEGKIVEIIEDLKNSIEIILDEEEDAYDNMPDNFKSSERGEISEMSIDLLEDAIENLTFTIEMIARGN